MFLFFDARDTWRIEKEGGGFKRGQLGPPHRTLAIVALAIPNLQSEPHLCIQMECSLYFWIKYGFIALILSLFTILLTLEVCSFTKCRSISPHLAYHGHFGNRSNTNTTCHHQLYQSLLIMEHWGYIPATQRQGEATSATRLSGYLNPEEMVQCYE